MSKAIFVTVILAIVAVSLFQSWEEEGKSQFNEWKHKFQVTFENEADEHYRRTIFEANLAKIEKHNSDPLQTYKMGINQFTIYTEEEFQLRFLNSRLDSIQTVEKMGADTLKAVIIDWTQKGAVGPVKNQGSSGSAGLYSTLGGVEGLSKVSTGNLKEFSQQQLKECVYSSGGGFANQGYDYYKANSVCTSSEFKSGQCKTKQCAFKISGYKTSTGCTDLASAILNQPISVVVDATNWSTYASGIFSNCKASLNHMVLLTGLADEYWKCKNSWGTMWGESGYIRVARGNTCGICSQGLYPTI